MLLALLVHCGADPRPRADHAQRAAEAAYVINELVKPASVIPSHANEVGTVNGNVRPGSKTESFTQAVKVPSHVPLSGKTMEFDAAGKCTAGC